MASFHFKGKTFLQNYHHAVKFHNLIAQKSKGLNKSPSLDDNLIIHGDNLKALKALLPTHAGKIKCIYIDPPYNTGNENWVYNDNVASPMIQEWLGKAVARDDLTRHDKWACMMYPRLTLLRELLAEDGVIFVSIDDNEQHRLRMLMDEIFGEENFITNIIWQKKYAASNDAKYFSDNHDFISVYAKNKITGDKINGWSRNLLPRTEKQNSLYKYDSKDGKGLWRPDNLTVKTYSKDYDYPIINPNTNKSYNPTKGRCWATNKETMAKWIKEKRVFFGTDDKGAPQLKRYLNEVQSGIVPLTVWSYEEAGHTDEARKELKELFEDVQSPFDNPKPTRLIKRILQIADSKNSIILDSFAGSGTTSHAILSLNKEDGGNRKFILIECEDYADKITAERMRRVIKGIPNATDEALKAGLGSSFSFYELGDEINMDNLLEGKKLPSFEDLAKYAFFTATGEKFNAGKVNEKTFHIGSSSTFEVFLIYSPDKKKLKEMAINLDFAEKIHKQFPTRQKLVFAPACFMEDYHLKEFNIRFAQLPFEIYRMAE